VHHARAVGNILVALNITEQTMETIDCTPTWGAIGLLMMRLALSNETQALRSGASEFAKAFAMAEGLSSIWGELTDEQRARVEATIQREQAQAMRAVG
jgi:hypothetical protein